MESDVEQAAAGRPEDPPEVGYLNILSNPIPPDETPHEQIPTIHTLVDSLDKFISWLQNRGVYYNYAMTLYKRDKVYAKNIRAFDLGDLPSTFALVQNLVTCFDENPSFAMAYINVTRKNKVTDPDEAVHLCRTAFDWCQQTFQHYRDYKATLSDNDVAIMRERLQKAKEILQFHWRRDTNQCFYTYVEFLKSTNDKSALRAVTHFKQPRVWLIKKTRSLILDSAHIHVRLESGRGRKQTVILEVGKISTAIAITHSVFSPMTYALADTITTPLVAMFQIIVGGAVAAGAYKFLTFLTKNFFLKDHLIPSDTHHQEVITDAEARQKPLLNAAPLLLDDNSTQQALQAQRQRQYEAQRTAAHEAVEASHLRDTDELSVASDEEQALLEARRQSAMPIGGGRDLMDVQQAGELFGANQILLDAAKKARAQQPADAETAIQRLLQTSAILSGNVQAMVQGAAPVQLVIPLIRYGTNVVVSIEGTICGDEAVKKSKIQAVNFRISTLNKDLPEYLDNTHPMHSDVSKLNELKTASPLDIDAIEDQIGIIENWLVDNAFERVLVDESQPGYQQAAATQRPHG